MADYSESLIKSLIKKVKEYPRFSKEDVEKYKQVALKNIVQGGYLILGTFSENGPEKCSGLNISRYSPESLKKIFNPEFKMIQSFTIDHKTPFDTNQNFLFSIFKK